MAGISTSPPNLREAVEGELEGIGYQGEQITPAVRRWTFDRSSEGEPDTVVDVIDSSPTGGRHRPTITLVDGDTQLTIYPGGQPAVAVAVLLAALDGLHPTG